MQNLREDSCKSHHCLCAVMLQYKVTLVRPHFPFVPGSFSYLIFFGVLGLGLLWGMKPIVLLCVNTYIHVAMFFSGDISELKDNIEWTVEGFNATRKVSYFGCCQEHFPGMATAIKISRIF